MFRSLFSQTWWISKAWRGHTSIGSHYTSAVRAWHRLRRDGSSRSFKCGEVTFQGQKHENGNEQQLLLNHHTWCTSVIPCYTPVSLTARRRQLSCSLISAVRLWQIDQTSLLSVQLGADTTENVEIYEISSTLCAIQTKAMLPSKYFNASFEISNRKWCFSTKMFLRSLGVDTFLFDKLQCGQSHHVTSQLFLHVAATWKQRRHGGRHNFLDRICEKKTHMWVIERVMDLHVEPI